MNYEMMWYKLKKKMLEDCKDNIIEIMNNEEVSEALKSDNKGSNTIGFN